jgi:hypothetical protein
MFCIVVLFLLLFCLKYPFFNVWNRIFGQCAAASYLCLVHRLMNDGFMLPNRDHFFVWRPDHNLQDIRNKVFPIKKLNVDSPKALTTLPAKRKQRSISSLVVDTPSVVKQTGLTGKRTKAKRRAAASLATSPVNNGTMKLSSKSENGDRKTDKSSASQSTKAATSANKTENQDQKKTKKISAKQSTRAATPAKKKQVNVKNHLTFVTSQFYVKVLYGFSCKNGLFSYIIMLQNSEIQMHKFQVSHLPKIERTARQLTKMGSVNLQKYLGQLPKSMPSMKSK